MKTCMKCGTLFYGRKCGKCNAARAKAWRTANPGKFKASRAKWKAENSEKDLTSDAKYRAAHKEQIKLLSAKWHAANKERVAARNAKWRAEHPEETRIKRARHYAENKERTLEQIAQYRIKHPERIRVWKANRRARERELQGILSSGLVEKLLRLQQGKCLCCRQPLGDDYHLDHVLPLALGGKNEDSNMQLLKKSCNLSKNAKHPVAFMRQRGFLL